MRRIANLALPFCLAAMDACWIYALGWMFSIVVLSSVTVFPVPPPPALAALELASWGLSALLLERTKWPIGVIRGVSGLLGVGLASLLTILINGQSDITHFAIWLAVAGYSVGVAMAAWFIGGSRASERPDFNTAYATFRLGLIAVVTAALLAVVISRATTETVWAGTGGVALWFFAWSLCALALGNRELLRRETGEADMRFWGILLAGSLICILFVTGTSGAFSGSSVLGLAQQLVGGLILVVAAILYAILYAIFWLFSIVRLPFIVKRGPVVGPTPTPSPVRNFSTEWLQKMQKELTANNSYDMSPEFRNIATWLVAGLIVLVAAWLISRGLRRSAGAQRTRNEMEERESLGSWGLFARQLGAWLKKVWGRFRPVVPIEAMSAVGDDLSALHGQPEWSGTL